MLGLNSLQAKVLTFNAMSQHSSPWQLCCSLSLLSIWSACNSSKLTKDPK